MKKILVLTLFTLCVFAACKNPQSTVLIDREGYQKSLAGAASCAVDADCVQIEAGCCQCDGFAAVNKKSYATLKQKKDAMCELSMCTMQYCFNAVKVSCKNKKCVTTQLNKELEK